MRAASLMLLLGAAVCLTFGADRLPVKTVTGWTIVVSPDAIPSEEHAAREFQWLFARATGTTLPISSETHGSRGMVFIGYGAAMAASAAGFSIDSLGEEDLHIRVAKQCIAIAGGRPRGTLYGVYHFFEHYLRVRFLTYDHTFVPPAAARASLPLADLVYRPPFAFRCSYYKENFDHHPFSARMRLNVWVDDDSLGGSSRQHLISHTLFAQVPVAKYGKQHPEYFALVNGVRTLAGDPQVCVSNPDVVSIVTDAVLKELDADPGLKNISVSQNDNDMYCRCDSCQAINLREGTPMGAHLRFVNAVAERVAKRYPDVKIGTLAYWYTRKPPRTIVPRENVQIQLCSIECCTLHPINDPRCARNREFCEDLAGWKKICKDIWIWNYNTDFSYYDIPFPNLRSIGKNVRYFVENNTHGVFMQANGNGTSGEMSELRNYVIARCLWNPGLESWPLVQEFCKLHYGRAAKPIVEYLTFLHENAEKRGVHPTCFPVPSEVGLDEKVSQKILGYFNRALKAAENDEVRARVEKASICAYRAVLEAGMSYTFVGDRYYPQARGGARKIIGRYVELCTKYNMSMANETTPFEKYRKELEQRMAGIPAVRVENATWRLTVVQGDNGKMVELMHKPTGTYFFHGGEHGFNGGVHEEWGERGYDDNHPRGYETLVGKDRLTLVKILTDGSRFERTISLEDPSGKLRFESTLKHDGDSTKEYQIMVHEGFSTGIRQGAAGNVAVYTKGREWSAFKGDWGSQRRAVLEGAENSGVAFFNEGKRFGVRMEYSPGQFLAPSAAWKLGSSELDFEVLSKIATLARGQTLSFSYVLEFMNEPPTH